MFNFIKKLGEDIEIRYFHEDYGFLFKKDIQLSEEIFRIGGMCSGFHEGYCNLIQYKVCKDGFDYGTHVVINIDGEIVLAVNDMLEYPYHVGGNIGVIRDRYYNLKTKTLIIRGTDLITSSKYLFLHELVGAFKTSDKVTRIDKITCEIEVYD